MDKVDKEEQGDLKEKIRECLYINLNTDGDACITGEDMALKDLWELFIGREKSIRNEIVKELTEDKLDKILRRYLGYSDTVALSPYLTAIKNDIIQTIKKEEVK